MRLARFRFSLRRLLIAVAVVALPLCVAARTDWLFYGGPAAAFRQKAAEHDRQERSWRGMARTSERWAQEASERLRHPHDEWDAALARKRLTEYRQMAQRESARADYHARVRQKYEHAASWPWWPVEPDPPQPR
jgi:hypothetical protein